MSCTRVYYYMYIFNHDGTHDAFEVVNFEAGSTFDSEFLGRGQNPSLGKVRLHLLDIEAQKEMVFALETDAITMRFANAMNNNKMLRRMALAVEPYETQTSIMYRDSPGFVLNTAVFMFNVTVEKVWMRLKDPNVYRGSWFGDDYIDVIHIKFGDVTEESYRDQVVDPNDKKDWHVTWG